MDQLIDSVNQLQDVFQAVGEQGVVELPQIVVVGAQSSGKSSVLENIVGRDFLPRGSGIVTRVPLLLQLQKVPPLAERTAKHADFPREEEWAEFRHKPSKIFTDFEEVRKEIDAETVRLTGVGKQIANTPIRLKIYASNVVDLTLVDLPGITKVPVGDQPKDIEQQIRNLVMEYVQNPNSIILAVTPANADIANSDSLKLAKEVDPQGERTLAVCTKLDLMDKGTDATDILEGRVIPVKLGIIGVINRSQLDIQSRVPIKEALKREKDFFRQNYPTMARRCGCDYLSTKLNLLLLHHIRSCLPSLRQRIKTQQLHTTTLLHQLGDPIEGLSDKSVILLTNLNRYVDAFRASINGSSAMQAHTPGRPALSAGYQIYHIFHNTFGTTLQEMGALDGLDHACIVAEIRNAAGPRPSLFVPEAAFESLVKRQIKRLESPSLQCVDLVHDKLVAVLQQSLQLPELKRFGSLRDRIMEVALAYLNKCKPDTVKMVRNLISIELAYINMNHPDFGGTTAVLQAISSVKDTSPVPQMMTPFDVEALAAADSGSSGSAENGAAGRTGGGSGSGVAPSGSKVKGGSSFLNRLLPSWQSSTESSPEEAVVLANPSNEDFLEALSAVPSSEASASLTQTNNLQVKMVRHLISSYFDIVRKTIQDAVPKTVMHFLVNHVQEYLQQELIRSLYNDANVDVLLSEDEGVAQERRAAQKRLEVLSKAMQIVSKVGEA